MSKKMWHKIFKSKSQKQQKQQQQLSKINKRHSRGIYEEYQQLNELLNGEKLQTICSENQMQNEMPNENENENKYGNVFEQQPPQSSFNSTALTEAQQLQQQQQHAPQLSTFTRVRNTFSLRRSSNNSNNNNKNVKPTNMESDTGDDEQLPGPPPGPLTTGHSVPVDEHVSSTGTDLTPCPNCSRTFNLSALRKHVVVCEKMTKKRKVFDSSRQRRDGTALSTYVLPKNFGLPNAEKASGVHTPPAASREASTVSTSGMSQSMQEVKESPQMLRRTTARTSMRKPAAPAATEASPAATAATVTATAAPAAAGAPPLARDRMRSSDRSLARRIQGVASERCPHCERSFNPKAFDRHVEWCKEKAIQATIKSSSTTETSKAKERMEARKQYRPPNLKTKRSINRDKYSNEEQYEQEMVSPKQYTMSTSSMASSVHSDNSQKSVKTSSKSRTIVTQNTVSLHMTTDDINVSNQDRSRRKAGDTCQQIDDTMKRLKRTSTSQSLQNAELDCVEAAPLRPIANRRNKTNRQKVDSPDNQSLEDLHAAQQEQTKRKQQTKEKQGKQLMRAPTSESLQLAKLDCEEAAPLKPVAKRTTKTQRQKIEAAELLAGQPQVTMTFDELNGLIKRKGSAAISNLNMNMAEPEPKIRSKLRTSTSLVRQARRRNSAKENPDFDVRCIDAPPMTLSKCELAKEVLSNEYQELEEIPRKLYADYESKSSIMPHGEIQIKLEASSMSRICRPKKRNNLPAIAGNAQPLRALPMPEIKQSLEALGVNLLPRLEFSPPHKRYDDQPTDDEDDELDAELDINEEAYEEANIEIGQLLQKAKLLEEPYDYDTNDIAEDLQDLESEDEQVDVDNGEQEQEATVKLPPISRRLVVLEQDEDGTMYIKAHKSKKRGSSKSSSKTRSTGSNDSGSVSSEKSASNSRYATASSSSGGGGGGSADEKSLKQDESQKREIFISIETEPNAQGSSPISPDSLRHMVGNAQTPIDVLHIENGNEPEHAKFSKISDNEEQQEAEFAAEASRIPKRRPATAAGSSATLPALSLAPNVEANNAKNAFERMRNDFQQLGEQIGASVRRDLLQRQEQVLQQQQQQQIQAQQQELKANSPLTPSPSGDSDEQSSLDGYPMSSSHSSHHGVSFKNSTDSAYGSSNSPASLSRQRSSEIQLQSNNNNNKLLRPHTASGALSTSSKQSLGVDAITQAQCDYGKPLKARQRMFAGGGVAGDGIAEYSSSGSEQSLPAAVTQQQTSNYNYQQQQQLQHQHEQQQLQQYQQPYNNNNGYELNANNLSNSMLGGTVTPTMSQHSLMSNTSNGSSSMTTSMKMSKFCHECGCKFVLEQAKFCTECGVKRAML
ncbi:uncharacterized protein LOC108596769 isoform X3 [Drosophila busckii]|uniref:uncharacterized protein LOC108596769 isoform X3 n=1 Tax=Drosophila busckii TaxID=30019 RepID=UPI00083EF0C3|nr:uncharacterized protein LOC108596769 isoform X3 [Drosophila busckii]